jgi:branched-chain amino acid aminotransferase
MSQLILNGRLANNNDISITHVHRAFNYGDGVFETMKIADGRLLMLELHYRRLIQGMESLGIDKESLTVNNIIDAATLLSKSINSKNCRVKLVVFRTGEGLYKSSSKKYSWLMEATALSGSKYVVNETGLATMLSSKIKMQYSGISSFKTLNCLPYILAGQESNSHACDDIIIPDTNGNLSESISSNIFCLTGNKLLTPDLNSGCIAGVFRQYLLQLLPEIGIEVQEQEIPIKSLKKFDSIFLTNVIWGIRWVRSVNTTKFAKGPACEIINHINTNFKI